MKALSKEQLWERYCKTKTPELREQIIIEYAPLVKLVAGRLNMYLGYNVEYEDLVSYGVFGLIDAIDKFDTTKDVKTTQRYAGHTNPDMTMRRYVHGREECSQEFAKLLDQMYKSSES